MRKPYFLIRGLSPDLREQLEAEANEREQPIQEVIRAILCEHYSLNCTPIAGSIRKDVWDGAATILVKMQPELFRAVKSDARSSGESMRSLILEALEARYVTGRKK